MLFAQEKLDVSNKKRSNVFNWRGQFTPEFVEYILKEFSAPGDLVLDPFSGSGTVLQESIVLERNAIGIEINPAAYAMSKFFSLSNLSFTERLHLSVEIQEILTPLMYEFSNYKLYTEDSDYRVAYKNLIDFTCRSIKLLNSNSQKILLLNILFFSEKDKKLTVKESVFKSVEYIKSLLLSLPYSDYTADAVMNDARSAKYMFDGSVDLILTSPPYINVFNYHQNYRAITEAFNYDILKVAGSEFGSNRKNRGNRIRTVVQYCLDMEQAIEGFWCTLKEGAKMVLVVGRESNVRSVPFYNSDIIKDIINEKGGFSQPEISERQFVNKFGKTIIEDIIVASKLLTKPKMEVIGNSVAKKHLEATLHLTDESVRCDIIDALSMIGQIQASPLFNFESIQRNA